jgi:Protein of unknown function (DUF3738)
VRWAILLPAFRFPLVYVIIGNRRPLVTTAILIALSVRTATGQFPARAPEFEVASVKPADPRDAGPAAFLPASVAAKMGFEGWPGTKDPGRIRYPGVNLQALLARAYNTNPDRISGPTWLDSEHYTIEAILPPGAGATYRLKAAKNGPKPMPPETLPQYRDDDERKAAQKRQVTDSLEKMIADMKAGSGVSIFTAIQGQLGLKLEAGNEQIQLLIVDKAEKTPTGN